MKLHDLRIKNKRINDGMKTWTQKPIFNQKIVYVLE
jgi:hypothetical protein